MHKTLSSTHSYDFSKNLLNRLNEDMRECHLEMERLRIVFKNLENSWLAINLEHRIVKEELGEEC